jgi:hypothetical protein
VQDVLVARRPTPRAEFLEMGCVQKDGNNLGSGPGRLHNPTNVDPADHTVTPYAVLLRTDTGDQTEYAFSHRSKLIGTYLKSVGSPIACVYTIGRLIRGKIVSSHLPFSAHKGGGAQGRVVRFAFALRRRRSEHMSGQLWP